MMAREMQCAAFLKNNVPELILSLVVCCMLNCFLFSRGGWSWDEAQPGAAGAEDGPEQGRHREPCHCGECSGHTGIPAMLTRFFGPPQHIVPVRSGSEAEPAPSIMVCFFVCFFFKLHPTVYALDV